MSIVLYSTGCPKCNILKKILTENNIQFIENDSVNEMQQLGFQEVPKLDVNGQILDFTDALAWARQNGGI